MINHNLKLLFIDITKTAGTAIISSLVRNYPNEKWEGTHHSIKNFTAKGYHITKGNPTCSPVTEEILKEYTVFTVVRNPFDRMVSTWHWGYKGDYRNTTFEEFIKNVNENKYIEFNSHRYRTQFDWISDDDDNVRVPHILRWENLQEEMDNFFEKINLQPFEILPDNTSKDRSGLDRTHYRDYYNEETKQIVEEKFKKDLEFFNYTF